MWGVLPVWMEKLLKWLSALIFDFNLNIKNLKTKESLVLILICQKITACCKY